MRIHYGTLSRRQLLRLGVAGMLGMSGCGTFLYPERRGQPAGPLDWKIVLLDAVGLLFFLIPGVIAFAVDFATGAIYLPPGYYCYRPGAGPPPTLDSIAVPRDHLTHQEIEQIVSQRIGRVVRLAPGTYRTQELANIEEFWPTHDRLAAG
jgi:hypothetical protein